MKMKKQIGYIQEAVCVLEEDGRNAGIFVGEEWVGKTSCRWRWETESDQGSPDD